MQLTEREKSILEALVELYVREAGPVSSLQLQKELGLELSSASIRNVLHRLEEKGFLLQPHTSAGRVPTRAGYRSYVDGFCKPSRLPEDMVCRIRAELQLEFEALDVHAVLERVSRLLAGLSQNVGVGFAIEDTATKRIHRVDLVGLEGARLLVVLTMDEGHVKTEMLSLDRELPPRESLDAAAEVLNEIVSGLKPAEARRRLDVALQHRGGEAGRIARLVLREKEHLFLDRGLPAFHLEGASQIVGQPEFTDPENLRLLVRVLDHPESLESLLLERGRGAEPSITIGVESDREEMRPFSLVVAKCDIVGLNGYVGILGPMRMRYALALALVRSVVEAMHGGEPGARGGPRGSGN